MSQLTLELPEKTVQSITTMAHRLGLTPEQFASKRLQALAMTPEERKASLDQLMKYAGACESTHGDANNESIDRDLANEAMDPHEEK